MMTTPTPISHILTEEQIEEIAEKAAEKAIDKLTSRVYQEVGKNVVTKFMYAVGAVFVGLFVWLKHKGLL